MDAMLFIFNGSPISQAGRRGFDPRLPLHFSIANRGLRHADSLRITHQSIRNPRSAIRIGKADVAQLAERVLGKDEVTSSILVVGSSVRE